ncbi:MULTISPECIES: hypothetical protein [unclassified Ruegeria]|uniref:hypothetical protein n=1 Tax=unclassified Ruegeria TaxID=2625375 RepID=UPI001487C30E|nr:MULTISPECIES: hypothetical protein [unclassified Ruegeria]NOD36403.1 hypothetical protein [Ruegeria sp. HKCCD7296]NOD49539.1 hypothetical protein [Ruegeria sp. HKCCD5849]NOD53852.1 hypothetical protein [Ruegeria sp. HKCCD5851]NOD69867.1 hypothetical protein [Ruegeria sp. HKCCD7303]NOE35496.1 hypothetical protein [Ruegeria sp. HKCCD7318]
MIDDEPQPGAYYDARNIWTHDPTAADMQVYERFASTVVDLVQVLDDNKPMLSRDVYARLFSSLLQMSRVLGAYEDGWSGQNNM